MLYFLFLNPLVSLASAFFIFPLFYFLFVVIIFFSVDALFDTSISLATGIYSILVFSGLWCYKVWVHANNSTYRLCRLTARFIIILTFSSTIHLMQGIFELMDEGIISPMDFSHIEKEAIKAFQNHQAKL